jgi:uncharacterized protein
MRVLVVMALLGALVSSALLAQGPPAAPSLEPAPKVSEEELEERPSAKELIIGGVAVGMYEKREVHLRASESYSAGEVEIPLVVVRGEQPGPVLCLVAGIHGDEFNGIEVVRRVTEGLVAANIRGTVIGAPIVNLFGFWNQSRYLPDRRDLNRHFPGRASGSTAGRIAFRFWSEVVKHCTHLIDFHTGSLHRSNLPQVRADLSREDVAALALAFGERVVVHNPGQTRTLRRQAVESGIPSILYEAGEPLRFQREHVSSGVRGVRRVMRHLSMEKGAPETGRRAQVFLETRWIRAKQGGIVELSPSLGDTIRKGDTIGVVTDPLRNAKGVVTSPYSGVVIGKTLAPTVLPGLAIVHVGVPNGQIEGSDVVDEELEEERPE